MPAFVILSEAKNLMDLGTYTSEILRLAPQNDVVGQPLRRDLRIRDESFENISYRRDLWRQINGNLIKCSHGGRHGSYF